MVLAACSGSVETQGEAGPVGSAAETTSLSSASAGGAGAASASAVAVTSATAATTGGPATCDERPTCEAPDADTGCIVCAYEIECAAAFAACFDDAKCDGFQTCMLGCPQGDSDCQLKCQTP